MTTTTIIELLINQGVTSTVITITSLKRATIYIENAVVLNLLLFQLNGGSGARVLHLPTRWLWSYSICTGQALCGIYIGVRSFLLWFLSTATTCH